MMIGWRARIGQIRPAAAIEGCEEWRRVAPEGVAFADARTTVPEITNEGLKVMMAQVIRAAREVACARVQLIVQCGAPGVFLNGPKADRGVIKEIEDETGIAATTMMTAMVEGLRAVGSSRPAVATIYTDDLNERLEGYLEAEAITPAAMTGLQTRESGQVMYHGPEVAYRMGRDVKLLAPEADGILISCGGLRTFEIIDVLERDTGVPVITSNQAALWQALRMTGVGERLPGLGRLLAEH